MPPLLRFHLPSSLRTHLQMHPSLTRFLYTTGTLLTWLPMISFMHNHVGRPMTVGGRSMYPFLNTDYYSDGSGSSERAKKDRVWVDLSDPARGLRRGMVVVFWSPSRPETMAVKRVIALEGDTVQTRSPYPFAAETVPLGHVWVEGEHPEHSRSSIDSNTYGPVPVSLLVGKVTRVVWPWSKAGAVRWQDWKGTARVREGSVEKPPEIYVL